MHTPMSDTFEAQLREMRRDLVARLRAQRGGARGRADAAAEARALTDEDDIRGDETLDLRFALEERETAELLAIDQALQRVADGSYGLCLQCGAPIPAARLHAQPTAARCVTCQTSAE